MATTRTPTPPPARAPDAAATTADSKGLPVVDGWYSLLEGVVHPNRAILEMPLLGRLPRPLLRWMMDRSLTRGVLLFAASVNRPAVGLIREGPGWGSLLVLRALLGRRRKLVVFQFILHRRRHPLRALLYGLDRLMIRRAMLRGHALSRYDAHMLPDHYGLPADRFAYVPWPLAQDPPPALPELPQEPMVMCAGRAYCDWETLFAAADGAPWPLTVVCAGIDRRRVQQLAATTRVEVSVLSDIPREEFQALLSRATVYVVSMHEKRTSQGHIRVLDGRTHGVPLVVTDAAGIADYVRDEHSALVVPPADPGRMRAAIDRLLSDRDLAHRLRHTAYDEALEWQVPHFFAALTDFMHGRPVTLPAAAPGAGG